MEIPPTHYPASRAASVVENCINYQQGTPNKVFLVQTVQQASMEDIPGRGHKYCLKFSVEEIIQKQVTVNCTAEVLYPPTGQDTAPEVNFTFEGEIGKNPDEEDNKFYQKLKSMKEPLEAQNIPDSFGNISPAMKPIRHLAWVACGYIIWQNSTEDTWYKMVKIQTVKQVLYSGVKQKKSQFVVSNGKKEDSAKKPPQQSVGSRKDRLPSLLITAGSAWSSCTPKASATATRYR